MIRFIARKTHNRYFIFICSHPLLIEDQPREKKKKGTVKKLRNPLINHDLEYKENIHTDEC